MNDAVKHVLIFATGIAVGSFATYKLLDAKFEKRYQEEVKSAKDVISRRAVSNEEPSDANDISETTVAEEPTPEDKKEYAGIVATTGYSDKTEKGGEDMTERPYVISPDEFADYPEYSTITLYYYVDGYVADTDGELIDDVEHIIGTDFSNHFGEYEDDSVFIRNDALKADYEILMSEDRYYGDVVSSSEGDE